MGDPLLHEPDPLPALRRFAYLWLLLVLLLVIGPRLVPGLMPAGWLSPQLYVLHAALLAAYLWSPWLARRLGPAYLPIALVFAAFGSQLILLLYLRVDLAAIEAAGSSFGNIVGVAHWLLLWPTVAVVLGWKYRLRQIALFAGALGAFNLLLSWLLFHSTRRVGVDALLAFGFLSATMLTIGYFVRRLSRAEQEQRRALAAANARLVRHAATVEQLAASRERNHLARELHDTLAHSLSSLAVQLEAARVYQQTDPETSGRLVEQALETTRSGLRETRRSLQALRASPLEDLGLSLAIEQLASSAAQRAGLELRLELPRGPAALDPAVEQGLYRIAQEAIANVVKHAAAGVLEVRLQLAPRLCLSVRDDGVGFQVRPETARCQFGLQGMGERAALLGATLTVESRPGEGACVRVTL